MEKNDERVWRNAVYGILMPAADAGEYRVKVHQNVTSPVAEEIPGAEFRFLREKSGLNWNRGDIRSLSTGRYGVRLWGYTASHHF